MTKKPLVLFLGNPLLADDQIGLAIGQALKTRLQSEGYDVEILERTGFALIDHIEDRRKVVIVDSVQTGKHTVGQIVLLTPEDFQEYAPFTSHYVGITEALELMRELDLNPPGELHIIGVEVEDPYTISEKMSPKLIGRLNELTQEIHMILTSFAHEAVQNAFAKV